MLPDEQATGEAGAVETTSPAAAEAALSSLDQGGSEAERDYEAEARDMGWYPEAEFKGKKRPAEFLDAKTFVERGEHVLPILQKEREKLRKEFETEYGNRFAKLEKMSDKTVAKLTEQHAEEIARLNADKDEAIAKGDVAGVRKIEAKIDRANANAPTAEPAKTAEEVYEESVTKFKADNDWYDTDDDLTIEANVYSQRLLAKDPNLTLADNLKKTAAYIKGKYPLKFKTDANAHAPVDSGALNGGGPSKDPFAKLSSEEKAMATKDMANFPKIYPNAQAWLKAYNS